MLMLFFTLGGTRFAIDAKDVAKVVPRVPLRPLPHAPEYVAGIFDCGGEIVPVIDLQQLTQLRPCAESLSTRIMLVDYKTGETGKRLLGLMAEDVNAAAEVSSSEVKPAGITVAEAPYLGGVTKTESGIAQILDLKKILPGPVQKSLFAPRA